MHVYAIQTVYDFYAASVNLKKADNYILAQMLRIAGISAKDLTKEGNQSVAKTWDSIIKVNTPEIDLFASLAGKKVNTVGAVKQLNEVVKVTPENEEKVKKSLRESSPFLKTGNITFFKPAGT